MKEGVCINKAKTLKRIDESIDRISLQDSQEYSRTVEIYRSPYHHEEYKRLLFNGVVQHFSKLIFIHLRHAVKSLQFREYVNKDTESKWSTYFFSEDYFQKNAIFFIYSTFNKVATLLKFRFSIPDERFSVDLKTIHKKLKKQDNYKNTNIKKLIDELIGNHNYQAIVKARASLQHGLDPDYMKNKKINQQISFEKIIPTVLNIAEEVFEEHLKTSIEIDDEHMDYYRIKEITPEELSSVQFPEIPDMAIEYQESSKRLLNVINNYSDLMVPWVKNYKSLTKKEQGQILSFLPILSDVTFRYHEITRSFIHFIVLQYIPNWQKQFKSEVNEIISENDSYYFMNVSVLRFYSIYDKLANFFLFVYPVPEKKSYFKNISEWIIANDSANRLLTNTLSEILNSKAYKALDMIRQQSSHGWDLSLQQEEGTKLSTDYFTITLYQNLENIDKLIKTIYSIYPNIIKILLKSNDLQMDSFEDFIERIFNEENEYMKEFEEKHNL